MSTNLCEVNRQRAEAREKFRPSPIRCVLVAEAPPNSPDRFFYYLDVPKSDFLFLGVMGTLYPELRREYVDRERPSNLKETLLTRFKSDGFYLVDVFEKAVQQYMDQEEQEEAISDFVQRLYEVATEETPVILIKVTVYDLLAERLKQAGFKVIDERIPFPSGGWQKKFHFHFEKALQKAGLR